MIKLFLIAFIFQMSVIAFGNDCRFPVEKNLSQSSEGISGRCVSALEEMQKKLGLRGLEVNKDGDGLWFQWSRGSKECDGDNFSIKITPSPKKCTTWRRFSKGLMISDSRHTGTRFITVTAEMTERSGLLSGSDFVDQSKAALDSCLSSPRQ